MKHEVIIAIIIGFGIGLVITFGIYQAQKVYVDNSITKVDTLPSPSPEIQSENTQTLTIESPANFSLIETETVVIEGLTTPNAYVTLLSESEELIVQADISGEFTFETSLSTGANLLTITSIDTEGKQTSKELTLSFIEKTPSTNTNSTETEADE